MRRFKRFAVAELNAMWVSLRGDPQGLLKSQADVLTTEIELEWRRRIKKRDKEAKGT